MLYYFVDYFLRNDNRLGLSCGSLFPLLETLQNDIDQDVRYFAGGQVEADMHSEGGRTGENFDSFQDPFEMDLRDRSFSEVERVIYGQHLNDNIKSENSAPVEGKTVSFATLHVLNVSPLLSDDNNNKLESHC